MAAAPNREQFLGADARETAIKALLYVCAAAVVAVAYLVFHYTDYTDTLDNAVMLAECIAQGNVLDYYHYAAVNAHPDTVYSANYNIALYLVFLVWNLPTVILHLTSGFDYMNSLVALLWCKALILATLLGIAHVLGRILQLVQGRKSVAQARILFLVNSCVVFPALVACQYDTISVLLMLWGLYWYLKGSRAGFIGFFLAAQVFKSFALFVFLPLLLIREKGVIRIGLQTMLVVSLNFVLSLPFRGEPYADMALQSQTRDALNLLLQANVQVGSYAINVFLALFIGICVFCYLVSPRSRQQGLRLAIFAAAFSMAALILFVYIRSYWVLMLVPFLLLATFLNPARLPQSIAALIVGTLSYTVHSLIDHWIYSTEKIVNWLALDKFMAVPESPSYESIFRFFEASDLLRFSQALHTAFVVAVIIILVINRPNVAYDASKKREIPWLACLIQAIATAALVTVMINANTASFDQIAYDAPVVDPVAEEGPTPPVDPVTGRSLYFEQNLFDVGSIEQEFTSEFSGPLERVSFTCYNEAMGRKERSAVRLSIMDKDTGQVLGSMLVGTPLIASEAQTRVPFDGVLLEAGHSYLVRFEPVLANPESLPGALFLAIAGDPEMIRPPALVDGQPIEHCVAMQVRTRA